MITYNHKRLNFNFKQDKLGAKEALNLTGDGSKYHFSIFAL